MADRRARNANVEGAAGQARLTPEAFADRFESAWRALWCIAAAVLGNRAGADDVLQEAAMIALGKLAQFDPESNFVAWMGRIVRFTALNHARRRQGSRTEGVDPQALEATAAYVGNPSSVTMLNGKGELIAGQDSFDDRVLAALQSLDETPRSCLLLRTLMDMPYKEISLALDIAEGTAMSHVHRARAALRTRLSSMVSAADAASAWTLALLSPRRVRLNSMNEAVKLQLEAYFDGLLTKDQEQQLLQHAENDEDLRDALEQQKRIDASIERLMTAPACDRAELRAAILGAARDPAPVAGSIGRAGPSWLGITAVAALLALSVVGAWMAFNTLRPGNSGTVALLSPAQYYLRKVNNFVPYWKCESEEQFTTAFRSRLGQPLMLKAMPDNISAAGIDYSHTLSPHTMAVLMRVNDKPVIVLVDRAGATTERPAPHSCGLFAHRKQVGDLVLVEVSPNDRSQVLDLFFNPDTEHPTDVNRNWK